MFKNTQDADDTQGTTYTKDYFKILKDRTNVEDTGYSVVTIAGSYACMIR